MIGDGVKAYDHTEDGHSNSIGGIHKPIINTNHPVQARVTYDRKRLQILVKIEEGDWEQCLDISNIDLPKKGYLGFTASTGGFAAKQELLAVTTATIERDQVIHDDHDTSRESGVRASSMLLFVAIGGVFALGYFAYQSNVKRHHF